MPQAFLRGAVHTDSAIRLRSRTGQVIREGIMPEHMLVLLPTEQPVEHPVVDGRANVGDGHRAFSSGASVMPAPVTRVRDDWGHSRPL